MHAPWRIFMALGTQWKSTAAGMGASMRTGLDYSALEPVVRSLGIVYPLEPQVFSDLRLMEAEALSVWSKRRA